MSFIAVMTLAMIAMVYFGYDEDDPDRFDKLEARSDAWGTEGFNLSGFIANHFLITTIGVLAETTTFMPLPTLYNVNFGFDDYAKFLTGSTTLFANTGSLYLKILDDMTNWVTGDEDAYYKRDEGPFWWQKEGTPKILKDIFKAVGFTGGTGDTRRLLETMEGAQKVR
jgi:hypothetical protein